MVLSLEDTRERGDYRLQALNSHARVKILPGFFLDLGLNNY